MGTEQGHRFVGIHAIGATAVGHDRAIRNQLRQALRKFVDDPVKRAIWSSVATIIAYVDVPIVYFSVRWWNSLHQLQSNPNTVSKPFWIPLRANAFGILFVMVGFIMLRARIAALRLETEMAPPPMLSNEIGEQLGEAV